MANRVYVQSLAPAGAIPVAVTLRVSDSTSAAVQHIILSDASSNILSTIHSYAGSNPIAVALTDATGTHFSVQTVAASQLGAPWSITGSVGASQLGAPWTVVASAPGQQTVTTSLIGYPTVIASVSGQLTTTASLSGVPGVVGSVEATQAGAPWSFIGSASVVLDATSGDVPVKQGADSPWSVTGSMRATQSGSWDVQIGRILRTKVATFANTVTRAGSYFVVLSAMEYASALRVMFSTRDAGSLSQACSVNMAVSQAVTSGTWVYEQTAAVYSGTLYQYNAVGEYIRLSFSNPVSHAYIQGAVYASPVT